jgi:hypothetical protein
LLSIASASGGAWAEPSAADRETARTLMDEGDKLIESRQLASALKAYRAAHALMGVPTTGIEVGKTEAAMGMLVEARDTLLAVSRIPAQPREPGAFASARQEATVLAEQVAARIPSLTVAVKGAPGDGELRVEIDGAAIPPAALSLPRKVNPGPHVVRARAKGFKDEQVDVTLSEAEERSVTISLVKLAASSPSASAPPPPPPPPPKGSAIRKPLIYGGIGLAGVGVVAGAVTGLLSLSRTSGLKDTCPGKVCPPSAQGDVDASRTLATVSNISFGAALLGAGAALVGLVVLDAPSARATQGAIRLTPFVGDRELGLMGRF